VGGLWALKWSCVGGLWALGWAWLGRFMGVRVDVAKFKRYGPKSGRGKVCGRFVGVKVGLKTRFVGVKVGVANWGGR